MYKLFAFVFLITTLGCTSKPEAFTESDVPITITTKGNTWIKGLNSSQDRAVLDNGVTN